MKDTTVELNLRVIETALKAILGIKSFELGYTQKGQSKLICSYKSHEIIIQWFHRSRYNVVIDNNTPINYLSSYQDVIDILENM